MNEIADPNLAREQRFSIALQQLLGYKLVEWEEGRAVIAYEVAADHLNRTNRLHGGVIATLCDAAAGYAGVYRPAPGDTRTTVTLSLTVNFVASVSGGRVIAEARKRGGGKTIFFSEVEVRGEDGRLVATALGTFRYVSATPVAVVSESPG